MSDKEELKAVLISGSNSGIGRKTLDLLLEKGYFVYAGARKDKDIEELNKLPNSLAIKLSVDPPNLAFIVPNPTELNTITLDWNDVTKASSYYVYRSTSYIWSVAELNPITTVSSIDYIDVVPSEGYYYYVVVAGNSIWNTSLSNCQYVEVTFPDLDAPELAPILPNPTALSSVSLEWDEIENATEYDIYRSTTYIWSVEGLTPVGNVVTNNFVDSLPDEGVYFYVIVASDGLRNSTHSNCEYIEYKYPNLNEFLLISSLAVGIPLLLMVAIRIHRTRSKQK